MPKLPKSEEKLAVVDVRLLGQSLLDVNLFAQPEAEGERVELRYHASIDTPERIGEHKFFFRCEFSVVKKKAGTDEDLQYIAADYACILQHPSDDLAEVEDSGKEYVATSAWNAFNSLFGLVSHQMRTPFPPLPPDPGLVVSSGRSSTEGFEDEDEVNGSDAKDKEADE